VGRLRLVGEATTGAGAGVAVPEAPVTLENRSPIVSSSKAMHCVVITAYKDFETLLGLVAWLRRHACVVFIHLDKKSRFSTAEIAALKATGCHVERKFSVPWGGHNHLRAIVYLLNRAVRCPNLKYIHVMSGQDYPVKTFAELDLACDGAIYMSMTPASGMNIETRQKYMFYNLFFFLETIPVLYRPLNAASLRLQRLLGLARKLNTPLGGLYKGVVWSSMPAEVCRYVLQVSRSKGWLAALRLAYVPEEFFLQTAIMNSPYSRRVVKNNRRYTDWIFRNGSRPAVLDLSDYEKIDNSKAFLTRKIDSTISRELVDKLRARNGG
jgi:hypothetical protein